MPTSLVNGVQLYWETGGSGEPVILVHGSWGDHHNWDAVAPGLRESFKLVTYDRRGHSRSERPPGPGSVEEDAADLGALIEQMFQGPAHVVGNSFGAVIALRLAARRRDLFRSMAVHEPPLWGLLEGQPDTQTALAQAQQRIAAVIDLLRSGDDRGGAELFMETIAMGPGSWQLAAGAAGPARHFRLQCADLAGRMWRSQCACIRSRAPVGLCRAGAAEPWRAKSAVLPGGRGAARRRAASCRAACV